MFEERLKDEILEVTSEIGLEVSEELINFEHPAEPIFGDYSTNIALLSSKLQTLNSKFKNPRELAEVIVKKWRELGLSDFIEKIEVAGPGFINIWLNFTAFSRELERVTDEEERYGSSIRGTGKSVIIDYSAPNIAKPFGIGHLRSTNIGQALYNLYEFIGYEVIGDNHLGDWGTQFGKLIYQIKKENADPKELSIEELEKLYVQFHEEAKDIPEMEEEARKWFKKLEEGDSEAREIWKAVIETSLKEFNRVYELLDVNIDVAYGESFYLDKMDEVLADAREKGILKESRGALVVELPGAEVPALLKKSDGATTYLLRDLATIKFREKQWQPYLYIYEVGADQKLYFEQVFKVADMLGFAKKESLIHIAHGLIRWPTGKFSTRRGDTIHLEKVLNEAVQRAKGLITVANADQAVLSREKDEIAKKVGIGAIKYNDLKQNPRTDVIFDWDQMLTLSGNSGPYLQYTYARTQSILRKAQTEYSEEGRAAEVNIKEVSEEEWVLLRSFYRFSEVIEQAAKNYSPNLLCNFLFDLAQKFNLFYEKQRVIGGENERLRIILTTAIGQILKNGLKLLGIETAERM
ncbi:arginine--tRNA ligase [Patescibacteria group bacterium]|nr:arginine--tRNA ligase [Patescibacteria group bacterium]